MRAFLSSPRSSSDKLQWASRALTGAPSPLLRLLVPLAAPPGLYYIHTQHILHRDLKLSNVLVSKHGHVKLADLGLARSYMAEDEKPLTNSVITLWCAAHKSTSLGSARLGSAVGCQP